MYGSSTVPPYVHTSARSTPSSRRTSRTTSGWRASARRGFERHTIAASGGEQPTSVVRVGNPHARQPAPLPPPILILVFAGSSFIEPFVPDYLCSPGRL